MMNVTTPQFRKLLRLIPSKTALFTEMLHENSINSATPKLLRWLGRTETTETNSIVQIGGCDPRRVGAAARQVYSYCRCTEFNLNFGCPAPSTRGRAYGAPLMKESLLVANILKQTLSELKQLDNLCTVTVKCRIGVDELDSYEFLHNFIKFISEETGVTAFYVHAR